MYTSLILIVLGLLVSPILYFRFPLITTHIADKKPLKISVIIPARNEEKNIDLLLKDLANQSVPAYEIICVDDCSTDKTVEIVSNFKVKLISIIKKPLGWLGKSWACQKGAEEAEGELLLFLDADVRLGVDALQKISKAYLTERCAISVQPYHKTEKRYEQFSMFFNLVQYAANGLGIPKGKNIGLYGPVILISQKDYLAVGGHKHIKSSVIDDIALGQSMNRKGIPFKLFLGDNDIYFRMYSGGFSDLFRGWLKNIVLGAVKTPILRFVMIFLWIASCLSVTLNLISSLIQANMVLGFVYVIIYLIWVIELLRIAKEIGNFNLVNIVLFPIPLAFFLIVCILSLIKKPFRIKTVWKGRKV